MMRSAPFRFYTSVHLVELTGRKATNLTSLLEGIETTEGSSIFHHTHQYLREHHFSPKVYGNDFSSWILNVLHQNILAEKLANIDIRDYPNIRSLREVIAKTIRDHLATEENARIAFPSEAFHFCKSITFYFPTEIEAKDLTEFCGAIQQLGRESIYFHFFEARLRLEKNADDFSVWIEETLQEPEIAASIRAIDPYSMRFEALKNKIVSVIQEHLKKRTPRARFFQQLKQLKRFLPWLK